MTKTTTTYALPDDARAEMRRVLENEFRSFLAHDPHDPDRFWGLAVDAVMRAAARAETTATEPCPDHNPVQHRDGSPPWCPRCGLTAAMTEPVSRFKRDRAERNLDLHPTGNNPIGDTK